MSFSLNAEKRYYFMRGGDLPVDDGLETVDLRPGKGALIAYNNLTLNAEYDYPYFQSGASWWSFNQNFQTATDMGDVDGDWYFVCKIATTITYNPINIILNNTGPSNCFKLTTDNFPLADRTGLDWKVFKMKISDYPVVLSYTGSMTGTFFQLHADGSNRGMIGIDYAYLTNDPAALDNGTAVCFDCEPLDTPAIASIDADGTITFNPVPDAATYKAYIYKDEKVVYSQTVASGDKLRFTSAIAYTYTVKLQAVAVAGSTYLDSEFSEAVLWNVEAAPLGASELCNEQFAPSGGGGIDIYMTWQTELDGRIIITIAGVDGTPATFRSNNVNVAKATINGKPMMDCFSKTVDGSTVTLTPVPDAQIAFGEQITGSVGLEWKTTADAYGTYQNLNYTYGTSCVRLDTPEITSIDDEGTVAFEPVPDAGEYRLYVYKDDVLVHTQTIVSGGKITYPSYIEYVYAVRLQALADGTTSFTDSELSESVNWTAAASPLGVSEYCEQLISRSNNAESSYAYLLWSTDEQGNVVITITGHNENEAYFRGGNGMNIDNFKIAGMPLADCFTKTYRPGSSTIIFSPKPGAKIDVGDKITFNGGVEWLTSEDSGAANTYHFEYTYGTSCVRLNTPEIIGIDSEGVITFTPVSDAAAYQLYVYRNLFLVHKQDIKSGDKIEFYPNVDFYIYDVHVKALSDNEDMLHSDLSEVYYWSLYSTTQGQGKSEYCQVRLGDDPMNYVYISFETNPSGDIEISLKGETEDEDVDFRGNGMNLDYFKIYGRPLKDYFTKIQNFGTKKTVLQLADDNTVHPGDIIVYSGNVEWRVFAQNASGNYSFMYTYGTNCAEIPEQLSTPNIISISSDGSIAFNPVPNAGSYTVYVYRDDNSLIYTQTIEEPGERINFTSLVSQSYWVKIKALPEQDSAYSESDLSEGYAWEVEGKRLSPPVITGVSGDGVITFEPVKNAKNYSVFVYRADEAMVHSDFVTASGEKINFTPVEALYTIRLRALPIDGFYESDLSEGYLWSLSSENPLFYSNAVLFYPNPVTDMLHFSEEIEELVIYSLQGQLLLLQQQVKQVDASSLSKGFYILQMTDKAGNRISGKIEIR